MREIIFNGVGTESMEEKRAASRVHYVSRSETTLTWFWGTVTTISEKIEDPEKMFCMKHICNIPIL